MDCRYCQVKLPRNRFQCPSCRQWNHGTGAMTKPGDDGTVLLSEIQSIELERHRSGPWDKNFGNGGVVTSSVNLIGGVPGAGKSTLLLQLVSSLGLATKRDALLIGAEENEKQVKDRAVRLRLPGMSYIRILPIEKQLNASLEAILEYRKPCCCVIDSISTYASDPEEQVKLCLTFKIFATKYNCPFFVVCHVTKVEGLAGLMKLQHGVDMTAILYNEKGVRVFHTEKNRNGPDQVDTFYLMTERGLIETEDPDAEESE